VRLPSGTQGWVKASYLSAAPPLQQQLTAQVAELERLHAEVARLQEQATAARPAVPITRPVPVDPPAPPVVQSAPLWQWALGFCLLGLIGGFVLGWRMLDRRIRRKYGGLRIY
jgi:hypothetical protein